MRQKQATVLQSTKNEFPCWGLDSEGANDPAFGEAEGDDDEDKVEDHHDPAHGLGHLPLEDDDGYEDKEEHDEEHPNGAADANAVHLKKKTLGSCKKGLLSHL